MLFQDYNIIVDDKKLVAYWPVWMDDIRDSVTIEAKIEPDVKVTFLYVTSGDGMKIEIP